MKIVPQSVQLVWVTPKAAYEIEMATRTCYKSEAAYDPDKTADFLDRVINQNHHHSVVEHACASFRVICDRGVSHEFVRHRLASFSQESTRYCNYGKDKFGKEITVIEPPDLTPPQREAWVNAMLDAEAAYFTMLVQHGCAPQIARSVLPTCLKTEFVITANFREWLHIIELRTAKAAHPQIREIVLQIQAILQRECPEIFGSPPQSS